MIVKNDQGCSDTSDIVIKTLADVIFPNAFTPNGDGLNDIFLPILVKNLQQYHMIILNRWGIKVFESDDPSLGWNGSDNGTSGEVGAFLWILDYTVEGGTERTIKGSVTLLR